VGAPDAANPVLDTTGQYCGQLQVDRVWFLAGTFGPGTAVRSCDIPAGKARFFPLINNAYFAFLSDPPDQRTGPQPGEMHRARSDFSIDGSKVAGPLRFFTGPSGSESPIFNVQLPPGNIFGLAPWADYRTSPII
jgi:hypothetical protein